MYLCVASFDAICAASNASNDEPATGSATDSFLLCTQHYYAVHKYYNPEECALCAGKRRYRVSSRLTGTFRPVPHAGDWEL